MTVGIDVTAATAQRPSIHHQPDAPDSRSSDNVVKMSDRRSRISLGGHPSRSSRRDTVSSVSFLQPFRTSSERLQILYDSGNCSEPVLNSYASGQLRILNRPMLLNLYFHTPSAASASGCPEQLLVLFINTEVISDGPVNIKITDQVFYAPQKSLHSPVKRIVISWVLHLILQQIHRILDIFHTVDP